MNLLRLISLLIYTFGVYIFGAFLLFQLQHRGRLDCSVKSGAQLRTTKWAEAIGSLVMVFCFFWFVVALLVELSFLFPSAATNWLRLIQLGFTFFFPPLIMHVVYADSQLLSGGRLRHPLWRIAVGSWYALAPALLLCTVLMIFDVIEASRQQLGTFIGIAIGGMFAGTSIFAILATTSSKKRPSRTEASTERSARRWMVGLYVFMIPLCVAIIVSNVLGASFGHVIRVVGSSMPLAFVFAGTYFDQRFVFIDVFFKRGLSLLLTIVLLTSYFGLLLPRLDGIELDWARPWVYAVLLLPVAMSLPWLYRRLGQWLDNFWLGRRFTTVEAVKSFLAGLQRATSEQGLVEEAKKGLAAIFRAAARIDLELREAPSLDFDCVLDVPIRAGEQRVGVILMGRRANQMPYFSEDLELVDSLADVFSYMLENIRLQQKKLEQEQRAQELSLQASRTELKALRAQINPHFLFNALNVIAGLIHKDPARADNTVEQLAEVFRYTLRGSEKEWARLDAELEFVRAYLEVEQARFGSRLEVSFDVEDRVRPIKIPTMLVQTLVENAVKHGVASITGQGRIEVGARREGRHLVVEVADNGSGFDNGDPATVARSRRLGKSTGYGLKNIRQRLRGYFGDDASLTIGRDEARGMTVARISTPADHDVAGPAAVPYKQSGSEGVA
jgi:hypothetical protein